MTCVELHHVGGQLVTKLGSLSKVASLALIAAHVHLWVAQYFDVWCTLYFDARACMEQTLSSATRGFVGKDVQ